NLELVGERDFVVGRLHLSDDGWIDAELGVGGRRRVHLAPFGKPDDDVVEIEPFEIVRLQARGAVEPDAAAGNARNDERIAEYVSLEGDVDVELLIERIDKLLPLEPERAGIHYAMADDPQQILM